MRICPNCESKLAYSRIRRSRSDKQLLCDKCGSLLEIDIPKKIFFTAELLRIIGIIILLYSVAIILVFSQQDPKHYSRWIVLGLVPFVIGLILYLIGKVIVLKKNEITLLLKASPNTANIFVTNGIESQIGEDATTEQYMIQFEKLSLARLEEILSNERWTENAKKAASELVGNKRHLTSHKK